MTYSFYETRNRRFHVSVAASLQVRSSLRYATVNENGAHVEVYASGFWGGKQTSESIFDVKVNAIAPSYPSILTAVVYRCFEREKLQRKYEQRIREIEMGSFTPLVFSTLRGSMGHTAQCYILQKTCSPCLFSEGEVL